jgi:hypothetical protein
VRRLVGLVVALALLGPAGAWAHTLSETHSSWRVEGANVRLTFTVPDLEAKRLAPNGDESDAALAAYLTPRVYPLAGGTPCPRLMGPQKVSSEPGYRRFEFEFACGAGKGLAVHSGAFFREVPSHVNYAQVQTADGTFIEQLITADQQTLDLSSDSGAKLRNASFFDYMYMGIHHIATGVDHMLFLVGLTMISRRLRDLVFVVSGFTIGHSLTLALAVTGLVRPQAEYIDALVALTIVLIGAENLAVQTHRPGALAIGFISLMLLMTAIKLAGFGGLPVPLSIGAAMFTACYLMISGHLNDAGRIRLIVSLVFGLIHGFGFAAGLMEMRLPQDRLAELLVGFNLGVEVGQLTVVLSLSAIVWLLVKYKWALPRPIVVDVAASFLVAVGLFWFVSRSYA